MVILAKDGIGLSKEEVLSSLVTGCYVLVQMSKLMWLDVSLQNLYSELPTTVHVRPLGTSAVCVCVCLCECMRDQIGQPCHLGFLVNQIMRVLCVCVHVWDCGFEPIRPVFTIRAESENIWFVKSCCASMALRCCWFLFLTEGQSEEVINVALLLCHIKISAQ